MCIRSKNLKLTFILLAPFMVASLACSGLIPRKARVEMAERTEPLGFDFTNRSPDSPDGDEGAPNHVFIHQYPMPEDGLITGLIYRNDTDEVSEIIDLLILRSVRRGWEVVHRVELPADDRPTATRGISTLELDPALPVNKGDVFAHWQPEVRPTGPIPLNLARASIDGLSVGEFGFDSDEVQVGDIIDEDGFTGRRDYFLNLIFKPTR
jgi:hypothetical protein